MLSAKLASRKSLKDFPSCRKRDRFGTLAGFHLSNRSLAKQLGRRRLGLRSVDDVDEVVGSGGVDVGWNEGLIGGELNIVFPIASKGERLGKDFFFPFSAAVVALRFSGRMEFSVRGVIGGLYGRANWLLVACNNG